MNENIKENLMLSTLLIMVLSLMGVFLLVPIFGIVSAKISLAVFTLSCFVLVSTL